MRSLTIKILFRVRRPAIFWRHFCWSRSLFAVIPIAFSFMSCGLCMRSGAITIKIERKRARRGRLVWNSLHSHWRFNREMLATDPNDGWVWSTVFIHLLFLHLAQFTLAVSRKQFGGQRQKTHVSYMYTLIQWRSDYGLWLRDAVIVCAFALRLFSTHTYKHFWGLQRRIRISEVYVEHSFVYEYSIFE